MIHSLFYCYMESLTQCANFFVGPRHIWWGFRVKTAYMRSNQKKRIWNKSESEPNTTQNAEHNTSFPQGSIICPPVNPRPQKETPLCNQSPLQDATPTNLIANSYSQ